MIGQSVLALYRFSSNLGTFVTSERQNDINYWRRFVAESYSPSGVMRQALWNNTTRETKQFEITTQVLARYYFTLFESGVQNIQIILENIREKELPNSCHIVDCGKTSFIYWFENGCHVGYSSPPPIGGRRALVLLVLILVGSWLLEGLYEQLLTQVRKWRHLISGSMNIRSTFLETLCEIPPMS